MQSPDGIVMGTPTAGSSVISETVTAIGKNPGVLADVTLVSGDKVHVSHSTGKRPVQETDSSAPKRACVPLELPKLKGSSRLEIKFAAATMQMVHDCGLISTPLSVASLSKCLVDGKAALNTDMKFHFDVIGRDLLLEYDHHRTHKLDDVDRDVLKTNLLAEAFPSAIIMRVRINSAPPLPSFVNPNVSIVHVQSQTVCMAMQEVAKALAKYVEPPFKSSLEAYKQKHSSAVDGVVHVLMMKIEPEYRDAVIALRALLGDDSESKIVSMMNTDGLTERYKSLVDFVRRVRAPPYNVEKAEVLFCHGIAAKLDDMDAIFSVFDKLKTEFKIEKIQTFMSSGVAVHFGAPEAMYSVLRTLRDEFKIAQLQTFVSNSVAAHFGEPEAMYAVLRTLRDEFKIKQLQTFVCDGVAAHFGAPEAMYAVLHTLRDEFKIKQLQTFMCGGVAAHIGTPEIVYAFLRTLRDEFKISALQTFMDNSVAAHIGAPEIVYTFLRTLRSEFKISALQTFMCNSVAARIESPESLYAILRTLCGEFKISNLASFVSNSIAAKFDDPERLFATLRLIYANIGKSLAISISCSCAFASRMYNDGFLDHVFSIYKHIKSLRTDTDGAMKLLFDKNNARLLDAIDALDAKVETVKSGSGLWKFIKPFKYIRGRPAYVAAISALKAGAGASTSAKDAAVSYDEADSECESDGSEP
jgi:hypothetical protein